MKLVTHRMSFVLVLVSQMSGSQAAVTREIQGFMSDEEIQQILAAANSLPSDPLRAQRWTAGVIPPHMVERLAENTPYNFRRGLRVRDVNDVPFHIKTMTSTTDTHVDAVGDGCYRDGFHQKASTLMFLNTNQDASFIHGDQVVAIEAGKLVNFQADEPHQTVINSGHVQILVPFASRRLMPPQGECDDHRPEYDFEDNPNSIYTPGPGNFYGGNGIPDEPGTICCSCDHECPSDRPFCLNPGGVPAIGHCSVFYETPGCCPQSPSDPEWGINADTGSPYDSGSAACAALASRCRVDVAYPGTLGYCTDGEGRIFPRCECDDDCDYLDVNNLIQGFCDWRTKECYQDVKCEYGQYNWDTHTCECYGQRGSPGYCLDAEGRCTVLRSLDRVVNRYYCPGDEPVPSDTSCTTNADCSHFNNGSRFGVCWGGTCKTDANCVHGRWDSDADECKCNFSTDRPGYCHDSMGACTVPSKSSLVDRKWVFSCA